VSVGAEEQVGLRAKTGVTAAAVARQAGSSIGEGVIVMITLTVVVAAALGFALLVAQIMG
jgi:hypothetical protein